MFKKENVIYLYVSPVVVPSFTEISATSENGTKQVNLD